MNKKERIKEAISQKKPDRLPYALWTHLPGDDLDPAKLAEKTAEFYYDYDIDLVKTMNNGMYAEEDFGTVVDYSQIKKGGVARVISSPVKSYRDWEKLPLLTLSSAVALQREIKSLKLLVEKLKNENVPIVFTVFSPLTTADKLSCKQIAAQIKDGHGDDVKKGLIQITDLTCQLVKEAISCGADGIFLATQLSSTDYLDEAAYREYGRPYDLQVIQASTGWCNILHAHGKNIMFNLLKDYPVDIFNWHAFETAPDLTEAKKADKCLMGGLVRSDITQGNDKEIRKQIEQWLYAYQGKGQILSPGCVIRYPIKPESLHKVAEIKKEIETGYYK